jgi:protein-disulfide isomerase
MNKPKMEQWVELAAYGLATVACAAGAYYFLSPSPLASQAVQQRSKTDESKLRSYLGVKTGTAALVEFMDFECPPCRATWPRVKAFLSAHPKISYRPVNFPLFIHPFAFNAATASEVARKNGKFDTAFEELFAGNLQMDQNGLNSYLKRSGMPAVIGKSSAAPYERMVRQSMKLASELGVHATPTLLLLTRRGELIETHSLNALEKFVD